MDKPTLSSKPTKDPIPDSLIEILCVRARWERLVMAEIRAAHGQENARLVMKLLTKLFNEGPGSIREKGHEGGA